jgi:hypothetical protein
MQMMLKEWEVAPASACTPFCGGVLHTRNAPPMLLQMVQICQSGSWVFADLQYKSK